MFRFGRDKLAADQAGIEAMPDPIYRRAARSGPVIRAEDFRAEQQRRVSEARSAQPTAQVRQAQVARTETALAGQPPVLPPADEPLVDLASIVRAMWLNRLVSAALIVAFMLLGAVGTQFVPKKFTAITALYFDPRQVADGNAETRQSTPPEVMNTVIESQTKVLSSETLLRRIVSTLGLDKDTEFAPNQSMDEETRMTSALLTLGRALKVVREDDTYVVTLSVSSRQPERSAEIANLMVEQFLEGEKAAVAELYGSATSDLNSRLAELAAQAEIADKAVQDYRASRDLTSASGTLIADKRLLSISDLLLAAQKTTINASARLDAAKKLKLDDVLAGNVNGAQVSTTLSDLRRQFATQSANVSSLAASLGQRHPSLAAAKASLAEIRQEIRREIDRTIATAQSELEQARKAESDVAKQLSVQKALQSNMAPDLVQLAQLEQEAQAKRASYQSVLRRSQAASQEQNLVRNNIRVISKAITPLKADGPGSKVMLAAGLFGGLLAGIFIAMIFAFSRTILPRIVRQLSAANQSGIQPAQVRA